MGLTFPILWGTVGLTCKLLAGGNGNDKEEKILNDFLSWEL